jgi:hypothetical protein
MPPEIRKGEKFSKAGDIYSLGIVLYQLFTGHLPLPISEEHIEAQVARIHETIKPTPPREYNPDLPAEIQDVLVRALSKKPAQRPDADEIVEILQTHTGTLPTQRIAATARWRRTPPTPKRAVAGVALAGAVLVVAFLFRGRGPSPQATPGPVTTVAAQAGAASLPPATVPSATPTTVAPQLFRVAFDQGELSVTNSSTDIITDLQVTLVGKGTRYAARQAGTIKPYESALFSSDQFTPALPTPFTPDHIDLVARAPEGRRVAALPLK